jgi:hypothetical protein
LVLCSIWVYGLHRDKKVGVFIAFSCRYSPLHSVVDLIWCQCHLKFHGHGMWCHSACWGGREPLWVLLAVADWGVKLSVALLALLPFRLIVGRMTQSTRVRVIFPLECTTTCGFYHNRNKR